MLEDQFCFPLYVCAKEIVRKYKPYLDEIDLTYTQFITMMVLWEHHELNVKELGHYLYLDSGTLTPVLKKLEGKGYLVRKRSKTDERNLLICITKSGEGLKEQASRIPDNVSQCMKLTKEEKEQLHELLGKILASLEN